MAVLRRALPAVGLVALLAMATAGSSPALARKDQPRHGRSRHHHHRAKASRVRRLRGLTVGFSAGADVALASGKAKTQSFWVPRAHREGTQMVRLDVNWNQVAPAIRPSGFDAPNPGSAGYSWAKVDEQVRELAAAHFKIIVTVQFAPRWAEGPHMPRYARAGTWRPSASALGAFAKAIARRYDGSYPDPLHPGKKLPRIRYWQAWDEPNLPHYLAPQWIRRRGHRLREVSPSLYRGMENAFYRAVKAVSRSNYVVLAGLGPYGDSPSTAGSARMRPVRFERGLLCVNTHLKRMRHCGATYFNAIDSHPYGIYGPNWHAYWADDVSVPDVYKLVRVLHAAQRAHTVLPHGHKGNWVTEISWDTSPPDPNGVPVRKEAHWLEQALYVLWKQKVSTVLWWQLVDSPPVPSYAASYQAGVYYLHGRAKPGATAFRFPLVTFRRNRHHIVVWSRSPSTGKMAIQVHRHRHWHTVRRVAVHSHEVFEVHLKLTGKLTLRGRIRRHTSLSWTQRA